MKVDERIKKAEEKTNVNPTERQKENGNYAKGKVTIKGFPISIENPKDSIRRGVDLNGKEWETKMKNTYGYFRYTLGRDGDPIDVFLGDDFSGDMLYVIDQVNPETKVFDEHKVMFGFNNVEDAEKAYLSNYDKNWKGLGKITPVQMEEFRGWVYDKRLTKHPFNRYKQSYKFKASAKQRTKTIKLYEEVVEDVSLNNLKKQAGDYESFDLLVLEIGSPGGSVYEGLLIMEWLEMLSLNGKTIHTVVTANAYSIASLIMLVAHKRFISVHGEIMVHNPMVAQLEYANADELDEYVAELRSLEVLMRDLYCAFTGLDNSTIKSLMKDETYIKPKDAVNYGFVHEVMIMDKIEFVKAKEVKNYKIESMRKVKNIVAKMRANIEKSDIVNQQYGLVDGEMLEVYQTNPAQITKGDRTNIEEAEVTLMDGTKLKIEDWVITEINTDVEKPETETETETEDGDEGVKTDIDPETGLPKAADFNEGPAPLTEEEKQAKAKLEEEAKAKEAEGAQVMQPNEDQEKLIEGLVKAVKDLKEQNEKLSKELEQLKEEKMGEKIDSLTKDFAAIKKNVLEVNEDIVAVAEGVEYLSQNVTSTFEPEFKSQVKDRDIVNSHKSPFQIAKANQIKAKAKAREKSKK